MTVWRPSPSIRVKAIGIAWRHDDLLAMEVRNDAGNLKGVRPLGGEIEFGETWQQALTREFIEELGTTITISGEAIVMESLFEHEGERGHEIMFVAPIELPQHLLARETIPFEEADGAACVARWFDPAGLDQPKGPCLYPTGLSERLGALRACRNACPDA